MGTRLTYFCLERVQAGAIVCPVILFDFFYRGHDFLTILHTDLCSKALVFMSKYNVI